MPTKIGPIVNDYTFLAFLRNPKSNNFAVKNKNKQGLNTKITKILVALGIR